MNVSLTVAGVGAGPLEAPVVAPVPVGVRAAAAVAGVAGPSLAPHPGVDIIDSVDIVDSVYRYLDMQPPVPGARVLVAVWVHAGHNVDREAGQQPPVLVRLLHQLPATFISQCFKYFPSDWYRSQSTTSPHDVCAGGGGDPLPGVDAAVYPHRRPRLADPHQLQLPALGAAPDGLQPHLARVPGVPVVDML